jgi:alkylation response protein AidB-like acyl-CoA dehydrogenase
VTSQGVDERFAALVRSGALDLPLPGGGGTQQRWAALAALTADDVVVGRLAEAHADALAILAELGERPEQLVPGGSWGVWAAEPPGAVVTAERTDGGWTLSGTKAWCSGAGLLTAALVTAHADDGRRMFAVDLRQAGVRPGSGSWQGAGMSRSRTEAISFDAVPATAVGGPRAYLDRPGFWHGAIGVAACWHGAAVGVARRLLAAGRERELGPHAAAHLGAVDAALAGSAAALAAAARAVDADPLDGAGTARLRAMRVRSVVEAAATDVVDRVGRALGPGPLAQDGEHAQRVADLLVYLRQSHAEGDLETLGRDVAATADGATDGGDLLPGWPGW